MISVCDIYMESTKIEHDVNGDRAFSFSLESSEAGENLWIFCVLDGVSSANPALSSSLAAKRVRQTIALFAEELETLSEKTEEEQMLFFYHMMRTAILSADMELLTREEHCGTTISMAIFYGNAVYSANVGDSPMYLIHQKENRITSLFSCHNRAGMAVNAGLLTEEEALSSPDKRYLMRLAGGSHNLEKEDIYTQKISLPAESILLLGSDGALALFSEESLLQMGCGKKNMKELCADVRKKVKELGGRDDFTLIATHLLKE